MSNTKLRRRVMAAAFAGVAATLVASFADAATARVRWLPRDNARATHYAVYVRNAGTTHSTVPVWTGNPVPEPDGTLSALVPFAPYGTGANYFAVVALDSDEESALSGELATGTPTPCRNDRCTSKTACDFSALPNGSSCDDASFCNGMETCVAGTCGAQVPRDCADESACTVDRCDETAKACTHVASPGCCPACDSGDPCLAAACAAGDCAASPGTEIDLQRMRYTTRRSGIQLAIRGRFPAAAPLDPSTTGATLELRAPDGMVLHSSSVAPEAFESDEAGDHHRFAVSRSEAQELGYDIHRLDFRLVDTTWVVNAQMRTRELMDAFLEPTVSVVLRVGEACARRVNATCEQRGGVSTCG